MTRANSILSQYPESEQLGQYTWDFAVSDFGTTRVVTVRNSTGTPIGSFDPGMVLDKTAHKKQIEARVREVIKDWESRADIISIAKQELIDQGDSPESPGFSQRLMALARKKKYGESLSESELFIKRQRNTRMITPISKDLNKGLFVKRAGLRHLFNTKRWHHGLEGRRFHHKLGRFLATRDTTSSVNESSFDSLYPLASSHVDGLEVMSEVPNRSSIDSSIVNYRILPGIRSFPIEGFGGIESYYAADDQRRVRSLMEQISQSKRIKPLIIVEEKRGPYVLEGGHRMSALVELGHTHAPALVVLDLDSVDEGTKAGTLLAEYNHYYKAAVMDIMGGDFGEDPNVDYSFTRGEPLAYLATLKDMYKKYGEPIGKGSYRVVFNTRGDDYVVKVPLNSEGESDNQKEYELFRQNKLSHFAKCNLVSVNGIDVLMMERLYDVMRLASHITPHVFDQESLDPGWIRKIDAAQVGVSRDGRVKAYDFSRGTFGDQVHDKDKDDDW